MSEKNESMPNAPENAPSVEGYQNFGFVLIKSKINSK